MKPKSLRHQVLWVLQEHGPAEAAQVWSRLRESRSISRTAVHTVLTRLVADQRVVRRGTRRHYVYECQPSAEVIRATAQQAARDLITGTNDQGLVHFVDTLDEWKPEVAQKLHRLLEARDHARGSS